CKPSGIPASSAREPKEDDRQGGSVHMPVLRGGLRTTHIKDARIIDIERRRDVGQRKRILKKLYTAGRRVDRSGVENEKRDEAAGVGASRWRVRTGMTPRLKLPTGSSFRFRP